jgi:hypothetical protein
MTKKKTSTRATSRRSGQPPAPLLRTPTDPWVGDLPQIGNTVRSTRKTSTRKTKRKG